MASAFDVAIEKLKTVATYIEGKVSGSSQPAGSAGSQNSKPDLAEAVRTKYKNGDQFERAAIESGYSTSVIDDKDHPANETPTTASIGNQAQYDAAMAKQFPNGSRNTEAPPPAAIIKSAVGLGSDGNLFGNFEANNLGQNGAMKLLLPAGASKQEILERVKQYLEVTDVFPSKSAEKFLNDRDGSFLKQAQTFVEKQNAGDPNDKPYAQPILDSMRMAAAQYSTAPNGPSGAPTLTSAPKPV